MSNQTYNELWDQVQIFLDTVTQSDLNLVNSKHLEEKNLVCRCISSLFVQYGLVITKLGECYDYMVHPQKRKLIRKILDFVIARYLELRQELTNLECSEIPNVDETITDMRLTPQEIETRTPESYLRERLTDVETKENFMNKVLENAGMLEQCVEEPKMTKSEAILLIQMHERARQGRIRAEMMKNLKKLEQHSGGEETEGSDYGAALKIQQAWRGYVIRLKIKRRVLEEMILIGMHPPDRYPENERNNLKKILQSRYEQQYQHQQKFEEALIFEKEYVSKHKSNQMMQDIKDQVRSWYMSYKQQTGKFPSIPLEDAGGSAAVLGHSSPIESDRSVSKSSCRSSATYKSSKIKILSPKREEKSSECSYKVSPSNVLQNLMSANAEYEEIWKYMNEDENKSQNFIPEMIRAEKTAEISVEIRKVADNQLRAELEELHAALERDSKGKKVRKLLKRGRKTSKKSKKKKERDITFDRTLESLFEELTVNGIIRKYPKIKLSDFKGETSCCTLEQTKSVFTPPALGDVRQAIRDYCILPMLSKTIHQLSPLNRSLLIAGPKGCGKDMLVNAVCSEIGATLFDLTATNILGKYQGKTGLVMLIHLVNKISKLLQPSIIYIDEAEKTFLKKVPKMDKTDPKRLKKDISKIVKSITPTDMVMLIGTTNSPWECEQKALFQTYGKVLLLTKPDYSSVKLIWRESLTSYEALNEKLNIAVLAKLSDGYTIGTIIKALQQVMTCRRKLKLKIQPLTLEEILESLAKFEPMYKEEEEAFCQWYLKTPIGKNKQRALELKVEHSEDNAVIIPKRHL